MSFSDQKTHREILIHVYEEMKDNFHRMVDIREMAEEFENYDLDEIRYHVKRLRENRFLEQVAQHSIRITVDGVEKLDQEGYDTMLSTDIRYEILQISYEKDRGQLHSIIDADEVIEEADISSEQAHQNLWYLSEKGLVELSGTSNNFELTGEGRNRYEQYRDEGIPIPRIHPLQRFTQHTVEQGDREKAENVFREIVEIARDEVIVIDQYAKGSMWEMLEEHVPSVVDVKVLMSDKELGDENIELYHEYADGKKGDVELRYQEYWGDYPFHSRLVVRDREAGWVWDYSVADSARRHHTISQLRPVNLDNDLEVFDEAWKKAETVE